MGDYRLFYDDEFEALRQMVESGEGYKKTATHLWPGMKQESAYARLKVCLNPHGDQHLRFSEVIAAMKFNNRFDALFFACDDTGFERPKTRKPADEQAELQRQYIESVRTSRQIADRLERLTQAPLQAVRS